MGSQDDPNDIASIIPGSRGLDRPSSGELPYDTSGLVGVEAKVVEGG